MTRRIGLARRATCGALAVGMAAGASGGCGTALRSVRLDPDKRLASGTEVGVIYQMTRPRVTIAETPPTGDTPGKFEVKLGAEPDPGHRYALMVAPGAFNVVTNLDVALDTDGTLKSLSYDSAEQVTPTVKAIGDFAVSVLGAVTAGLPAGLFGTDAENAVGARKKDELLARLEVLKREVTGLSVAAAATRPAPDAIDKVRDAVVTQAASRPKFDDAALADVLRGLDDPGKKVFALVAKPGAAGEPPALAGRRRELQQKARAALAPGGGAGTPPQLVVKPGGGLSAGDAAAASRVVAAEWGRVVAETREADGRGDLLTLVRLQTRELAADNPPGVPDALKNLANDAATAAAADVLARIDLDALVNPPAKPTGLQTPEQARYAEVKRYRKLAGELDDKWRAADPTDAPARAKLDTDRTAALRRAYEWAGAAAEFDEFVKLRKLVAAGPPVAADAGQASPLQEYAAARARLADVNVALGDALKKVAADAEPAAPKPPAWEPKQEVLPFHWHALREATEVPRGAAPGRRLLVAGAGGDPVADRVAAAYGTDFKAWPRFVVKIDKARGGEAADKGGAR